MHMTDGVCVSVYQSGLVGERVGGGLCGVARGNRTVAQWDVRIFEYICIQFFANVLHCKARYIKENDY